MRNLGQREGVDTNEHFPPDLLVTPNFKLWEFGQPAGYGLDPEPYPLALVDSCLRPLCQDVLEIIRAEVGGPLSIISAGGWRSREYQRRHRAARGPGVASFSQHSEGRAADIRARGLNGEELHDLVLRLWTAGKLPALGGLGLYRGERFTHVDIRPHKAGELDRW